MKLLRVKLVQHIYNLFPFNYTLSLFALQVRNQIETLLF